MNIPSPSGTKSLESNKIDHGEVHEPKRYEDYLFESKNPNPTAIITSKL